MQKGTEFEMMKGYEKWDETTLFCIEGAWTTQINKIRIQLMMELSMGYGHDWNRLKRIIEALNIRERIVVRI